MNGELRYTIGQANVAAEDVKKKCSRYYFYIP